MVVMLKTGDKIDEYEIIESLGQGGFSQIYKARAPDGLLVTLKFPMPSLLGDLATYERFRREFVIGQKLTHPAMPRAIAMAESPEGPYLVLEYVEGCPFRNYLYEHSPLPEAEAVNFAVQLSRVLSYIHAHGVYHRDLKPENIIVDVRGNIHILDFGIALLEGARRVTWGPLSDAFGTADYMSPEQIQGKRGDARSDLYSLGIITYEMLTGRVPFSGDNPLSVMSQHLTVTPLPPSSIISTISPVLEAIVLKLIRRVPTERYQSADDLTHDLEHLDELDLIQFSFAPEPKTRGVVSDRQIWILSIIIAASFLAVAVLIVVIVFIVKHG